MWTRIEKATFWIMVGIALWAIYLAVTAWTIPADPHAHSVRIPADNRTLLDDLPDLSCTGLLEAVIDSNPRMDQDVAQIITDQILTFERIEDLDHRATTTLAGLEPVWCMSTTEYERNEWRTIPSPPLCWYTDSNGRAIK